MWTRAVIRMHPYPAISQPRGRAAKAWEGALPIQPRRPWVGQVGDEALPLLFTMSPAQPMLRRPGAVVAAAAPHTVAPRGLVGL